MLANRVIVTGVALALAVISSVSHAEISGNYLETRTCQVYTGPCFANAEVGLAGKSAVMAWNIRRGEHNGVDLSGLNVVVALNTSKTLGFQGIDGAGEMKSIIIVDEQAKGPRRAALIDFAKTHAGKAGKTVVRIDDAPISMSLNEYELQGKLKAGKVVQVETRKARLDDCICSNESAYYPPLAEVENFAAGVTTIGEFKARGLGVRWSTPESRSAYLATFTY
jgi:hypothetical protein